jgi:phage head maturation protease
VSSKFVWQDGDIVIIDDDNEEDDKSRNSTISARGKSKENVFMSAVIDKAADSHDDKGKESVRRAPIGGATERRFADFKSATYDAKARTVEAVLSVGAEVQRGFGTEVLVISPAAVNLERLTTCGIPLIDSHNVFGIAGVFGKVVRAWFDSGQLMGMLAFDDSAAGRMAEGLVSRGTVRGISIGYKVDEWEITDSDDKVVDPDRERLAWDEEYTFSAKRWELLEVSLVSVPADPDAFVRSLDGNFRDLVERMNALESNSKSDARRAVRARMAARQAIASR